MINPTYHHLKAVKLSDYRVQLTGSSHRTLDGYALYDTQRNELVTFDGQYPYVLNKKKYIQCVVDSGVYGKPKVYYSSAEQRASINH